MRNSGEIKTFLTQQKSHLVEQYGIREIGLFGSVLKKTTGTANDIDILVDFFRPIDLFSFIRLKNQLSDSLGAEVDLVMKSALKPRIRDRILDEVVYL